MTNKYPYPDDGDVAVFSPSCPGASMTRKELAAWQNGKAGSAGAKGLKEIHAGNPATAADGKKIIVSSWSCPGADLTQEQLDAWRQAKTEAMGILPTENQVHHVESEDRSPATMDKEAGIIIENAKPKAGIVQAEPLPEPAVPRIMVIFPPGKHRFDYPRERIGKPDLSFSEIELDAAVTETYGFIPSLEQALQLNATIKWMLKWPERELSAEMANGTSNKLHFADSFGLHFSPQRLRLAAIGVFSSPDTRIFCEPFIEAMKGPQRQRLVDWHNSFTEYRRTKAVAAYAPRI